jgi:alcohol dehydrogenase class IV
MVQPLSPFFVASLPEIRFGSGKVREIPEVVARYGRKALLVTGRRSFLDTPHWERLLAEMDTRGVAWEHTRVEGEPSPRLVDQAVARFKDAGIDVVAGIGGGSVLDAAKAIAGLLITGRSVMDHLEGVGAGIPYEGPAVPLVAVPTTAGTGSEATKNAVLSERGEGGFKKSFRHEQLVARVAIVDPDLLASCPKPLVAADGMDAFTQLLESYVSANASPLTDALAFSGLRSFRDGFWAAWETDHPDAAAGYGHLAYASLMSGITLAQAGLGSVHGLASPLGAYYPIPHGVVCGTLVAEATDVNLRALRERAPESIALEKYAQVSELLTGRRYANRHEAGDALVQLLRDWLQRLSLPHLGAYGMQPDHLGKVVANCRGGSMKTNPIVLTDEELKDLLSVRM